MNECSRCGVPQEHVGICVDCAEVTGAPMPALGTKPQEVRVLMRKNGKFTQRVSSSLRVGQSLSPDQRADILLRTARGESANQIAFAVGCSSRAVTKLRARSRKSNDSGSGDPS